MLGEGEADDFVENGAEFAGAGADDVIMCDIF